MASAETERRFWEFYQANPQVYQTLVARARQAKARGFTKIGIRMLWEVMRWDLTVAVTPNSDFKLNDHYTSLYARWIMKNEPDLADCFEIRNC